MKIKIFSEHKDAVQKSIAISVVYFVISFLWILCSDTILNNLGLRAETMGAISIVKGSLFVVITSILLFFLLKKYLKLNQDNPVQVKNTHSGRARDWFDPVILMAVFVFVLSLFLWMIFLYSNNDEKNEIKMDSVSAKENLLFKLSGNEDYIQMLAEERASGSLKEENFISKTSRYLEDHKEFINITWVDSNSVINAVSPINGNKQIIGLKIALPEPKTASELARSSKKIVYTTPFEAIQGESSFELWVPVFKGNKFLGFLAGVYSCERVLENALPSQFKTQYNVSLYNNKGGLLGSTNSLNSKNLMNAYKLNLDLGNSGMYLVISKYGSAMNWVLIFLGILIFGLLGALGYGVWLLKIEIRERKETVSLLMQSEKKLFENQHFIQSIIDNSQVVVYVFDVDGKCCLINNKFRTINNLSDKDYTGLSRHELIPKEFADDHRANDIAVIKSRKNLSFEEYILENGEMHTYFTEKFPLFDSKGEIYAVCGISTDITERKKSEDAIRRSEEKFNKAFHNSPDAITITRASDGCLLEINQTFERLSGYKKDEVLGKTSVGLNLWQNEYDRERYIKLLKENKLVIDFEASFRTKSGELRDFSLSGEIYRMDGQDLILGILRDITEKKSAREKINKLNEELENRVIERTSQLEDANRELEAFSFSVSHDLRAPLRSIFGFSNALLENYNNKIDSTGMDYLNRISSSAQKMNSLIEALLNLAKLNRFAVNPEPINLSVIAESVFVSLKEQEPGRNVEFVIEPDSIVNADPVLIKIVMQNLIENAWKFTSKKDIAKIEFGKTGSDGSTVYFVKDDGAGFDMEYAGKLFSPFQRLHSINDFSGTGIGLATVQRIIHRHNGKIYAEGEPGKGAAFYFTIGV